MNAVRSMLYASIVLGFGVLLGAGAIAHGQPGPRKGVVPAAASAEQLSFDQPLNWMYEARTNYTAVKDYTCMLVSQERVNGKLLDQNIMQMKVKAQPFSVYLRWLAPESEKSREVVYVQGKNNGKMRVKSKQTGILGFVSIDPTDPRVFQNSRHSILEAGIGNMIEQTIRAWEIDRGTGKAKVLPAVPVSYNRRECYRVEVVHLERSPQAPCYRTVIFLDKVSKLPIRLENYDWPQKGGSDGGEKLEEFSYPNLQFNTGLTDAEFVK